MALRLKMWFARMCQYLLYFFVPLRKNRIMFYAHNRKGYVCNPKYLLSHILQREPGRYELFWVSCFPDSCEPMDGVTVVARRSFAYFFVFIRTKYFITNDMVDENLVKKKGQLFISTWHGGGAYKKVGIGTSEENMEISKYFGRWYQRLDYFVSSCRVCTELYSKAFNLAERKFWEIGTPRNDVLFGSHPQIRQKVLDHYHLPAGTKFLLFAPSFKQNKMAERSTAAGEWEEVIRGLNETETDGTAWVVLYRTHYFRMTLEIPENSRLLNGNDYYDMQELLYAADILVTDFSSSIWDFSLMGKPVFLFRRELREYERNDRGFFIAPDKWPYLQIDELIEIPSLFSKIDKEELQDAYREHFDFMGSFETGEACQQFMDLLQNS